MYLVFDIGGTYTKYAIMDDECNMYGKDKCKTLNSPDDKTEAFVEVLGGIYDGFKDEYDIEGIAISQPGMIDVENGIVYGGGNLVYLDKVHFADLVSERCGGLRVALENDAKCAALAEVWKGNAMDLNDCCLMILGTGVGGAVVKDRKVHHGKNLSAGEFSFFIDSMKRYELDTIVPAEGRVMAVEDYSDHVPYIASARIAVAGLCNKVAHLKRMPFEQINGELIYKWADEGDQAIINTLEDFYFDIAKECCNLQAAFDPEAILIGGGISAEPRLIEGINRYAERLKKLTVAFRGLTIKPCKFLNDSNLYGALYNFKQKYNMDI